MAGSIRIFQIELADRASGAHLALAAGREFDGYFYVEFGDLTLRLHPDQAARFASAVRRLVWRRRAKTSGRVWAREVGVGAGDPATKIELGLDDDGLAYVTVGSTRISCGDQQSDDLAYFWDASPTTLPRLPRHPSRRGGRIRRVVIMFRDGCRFGIEEEMTTPDPVVVEEIFNQLWFEMGARLYDFEFYSRAIPPLQEAYGSEAVAAALCRHHAMLQSQASEHIRGLRRNAARLKRERSLAR